MATTWATLFRVFLPVLMLKEMVVKMFQQPPQDSEMVEGNGVDDDQDAALDRSFQESSECGEIEAHRGPTHNIEQEDKCKLHPNTGGEAQEEGHGTLKEMVVKMFQPPQQDSEMVEENGVDDDHNAALDRSIRESSECGVIEANCGSTHNIEQEDKSKLHPDTGGEAQGHGTLKEIREVQAIDQHFAESQHPLSWKGCRRGKKRATTTESCEQKKRQRCRNWTFQETEQLVNLRLGSLRNEENVGRFGKNKSNEPVWEAVSKKILGRTPEQCQNRWDTVVRSYKTIKSHLDGHKKQFSQVTVKDFEEMKVASYFRSAEWYKMFDQQRKVWDLSLRSKGCQSPDINGASIVAGMPSLPTAGSVNPDTFPPEVVTRTSPLDQSEPTAAACELPLVCFPQISLHWTMMLAVGYFLFGVFFGGKHLLRWLFSNQS